MQNSTKNEHSTVITAFKLINKNILLFNIFMILCIHLSMFKLFISTFLSFFCVSKYCKIFLNYKKQIIKTLIEDQLFYSLGTFF